MTDSLRIGLLGCGVISQFAHLAALKKAEGVELVALCDVAEDLAHSMAERYEVARWYSDYDAFLDDADIEAVLIATDDQDHVRHASDCLRRGKHVLLEKPLGVNLDECWDLVELADRSACKLQVGNMKRFDPGVEFAANFIRERLGSRLSASGWYCDSAFRPAMQSTLRLPVVKSSKQRGFDPEIKKNKRAYKLVTHGCHLVNTLRLFGGEIAGLQARLAEKGGDFSWHAVLEFEDGAVGHFELTTAAKADWREGFLIQGEHGSVELQSFLPFFNRPSTVRVFDAQTGEYRSPMTPDSDPYERQVEAFARAIRANGPVSPDVHDGLADLAVIYAISESVETGKWVQVSGKVASQRVV